VRPNSQIRPQPLRVLEDASKGSGLIWEFGRTLVKQAVRS
jgi:hypothetical protein